MTAKQPSALKQWQVQKLHLLHRRCYENNTNTRTQQKKGHMHLNTEHAHTHTHTGQKAGPQTERHKLVSIESAGLYTLRVCVCLCSYRLRRSADPSQRWPIEPVGWVVKKSRLTEGETRTYRKPKCDKKKKRKWRQRGVKLIPVSI